MPVPLRLHEDLVVVEQGVVGLVEGHVARELGAQAAGDGIAVHDDPFRLPARKRGHLRSGPRDTGTRCKSRGSREARDHVRSARAIGGRGRSRTCSAYAGRLQRLGLSEAGPPDWSWGVGIDDRDHRGKQDQDQGYVVYPERHDACSLSVHGNIYPLYVGSKQPATPIHGLRFTRHAMRVSHGQDHSTGGAGVNPPFRKSPKEVVTRVFVSPISDVNTRVNRTKFGMGF